MTYRSSATFPAGATEWLAPDTPGRVLAVGRASAATGQRLADLGSSVVLVDRSASAARAGRHRHPDLLGIGAAPDALPFRPRCFDEVLVAQGMHQLATGLALDEFARVLAPGGRLAVVYTVRDDSVPWVRRLAAILRSYDPDAMSTGEELYSVASVAASPHFPVVEHRAFRLWVPITREGMLEMVSSAPRLATLEGADVDALLGDVAALYDSSARQPEPLLLPYSVMCWRAAVDHSELPPDLHTGGEGLQISL
jgi:SAM-dependent methyltransferase